LFDIFDFELVFIAFIFFSFFQKVFQGGFLSFQL